MRVDFSSYLINTFNRKTRAKLARNYCDNVTTRGKETCVEMTFSALLTALSELREEQGDDMAEWKADAEWISFLNLGAGDVPDIPWQNRGTHNHVVEILSDDSD